MSLAIIIFGFAIFSTNNVFLFLLALLLPIFIVIAWILAFNEYLINDRAITYITTERVIQYPGKGLFHQKSDKIEILKKNLISIGIWSDTITFIEKGPNGELFYKIHDRERHNYPPKRFTRIDIRYYGDNKKEIFDKFIDEVIPKYKFFEHPHIKKIYLNPNYYNNNEVENGIP